MVSRLDPFISLGGPELTGVASLRFIKACFRTSNHFMNRHYVKADLLSPMISLMEEESAKDNMLSSACMDILEIMRKVCSDDTGAPARGTVTY